MHIKRVFLIVLDSFGIGALPDAARFGDAGSNTLAAVEQSPCLHIPTLEQLGLFHIAGTNSAKKCRAPLAAYARMAEASNGKDTTTGHWEIAGIVTEQPFPTYPNGFPPEIITAFEKATGRRVLCNRPYSGTAVIADYGEEHVKTGALIVYTSADSVFLIAAHEDVVPVEQLYTYCRIARKLLAGEHAVGRVIARPFAGSAPNFYRTERRHDFSLVGNVHYLVHCNRIQSQRHFHFTRIDTAFQFAQSTQTSHEVYTVGRAQVFYAQYFIENKAR